MKDLKLLILITVFLVASVTRVSAQRRPENTASARAAYGIFPTTDHYKSKKKHKVRKNKQARASRDKTPTYRRRSNWAG